MEQQQWTPQSAASAGGSDAGHAHDDVRKSVVVAPMDGVVTSLQREQGESVIGAQTSRPPSS